MSAEGRRCRARSRTGERARGRTLAVYLDDDDLDLDLLEVNLVVQAVVVLVALAVVGSDDNVRSVRGRGGRREGGERERAEREELGEGKHSERAVCMCMCVYVCEMQRVDGGEKERRVEDETRLFVGRLRTRDDRSCAHE